MSIDDKIFKKVKNIRSYNKLYNIPIDLFYKELKKGLTPQKVLTSPVKVLLLTSTCNGFGDVVFSYKLKNYLENWYGNMVRIKIATNNTNAFKSIGEKESNLISLKTRAKDPQCRRFNTMTSSTSLEDFDLYLIAPITADFKPDFKEIHTLVKNSNKFNTFFLSEYNMPISKDILFNVGIGKGRCGLFLIDSPESPSKISKLNYPYSVIYIAKNDDYLENCYEGFINLLTSKYKLDRLDIVCPDWMLKIIEHDIDYVLDKVNEHYSKISYIKDGNKIVLVEDGEGKGELVFRFDIFPLKLDQMNSLFYYSLPMMLLTGDQSFTDGLSIRKKDSTIFYQGLPWKQNFYTSMAKIIPNKFFKSYKTSCGNSKALKYKPNLVNFSKKNDFRVKAKPLMDAVIMSVGYKNPDYLNFKRAVVKSRNLSSVKKELL
jgi:hypothetical protein